MRNDLEIAQIKKQYDGQWLVVEITKFDKHSTAIRNAVVYCFMVLIKTRFMVKAPSVAKLILA